MEKLKNSNGYTGVSIAVAVVIIFIFSSIIAMLIYNYNNSINETKLKAEATEIAIDEIEKIKSEGIDEFIGIDETNYTNYSEKAPQNASVSGKQGYYKTIKIQDYADINKSEDIVKDIVKKVTVIISYKFKNNTHNVELSTILSKEN